jgi:hypothetical protein
MALAASTAETHYVAETDRLPYVESILRDGAGNPIQLAAGDSVLFKMRRWQTTDPTIGGAAVIVAPGVAANHVDCGRVRYLWPTGAPAPATYECQWKVTFADSRRAHFPNYGTDVVRVSAVLPDPV